MSKPARRLPRRQRVAAYAIIQRVAASGDPEILLSRLSELVTDEEVWSLPGGGLDHGEDPRAAVVREVREETGLEASVGETARVFSHHGERRWRGHAVDTHALRIVYDGWVAADAPEPRTLEVGGSTAEAAWRPLAAVLDGTVPTAPLVLDALAAHRPVQVQRISAYALIGRETADGTEVLLCRNSPRAPHAGQWNLPGGGIDFGESPVDALVREVREETGLTCVPGALLTADDIAFTGTAPSGRHEEFHGIHLIYTATVDVDAEPRVVEVDGTVDAVAWVPVRGISDGSVAVRDVVLAALARRGA
ncbi:NUDIX domain-containing protein [Nocardioides sp. BP30]|uniref:NUDIX domain-containing protein n=1 Tax=Nocardioides sp. BP30 TaxID=3036374 RepID=UPI0024690BA3|nr:NUDIX domain-containing protein [Nocardioides sp. BP30]WGL51996.1 NUDIX domain-containing protein [Nocardioides sp. BP30]